MNPQTKRGSLRNAAGTLASAEKRHRFGRDEALDFEHAQRLSISEPLGTIGLLRCLLIFFAWLLSAPAKGYVIELSFLSFPDMRGAGKKLVAGAAESAVVCYCDLGFLMRLEGFRASFFQAAAVGGSAGDEPLGGRTQKRLRGEAGEACKPR